MARTSTKQPEVVDLWPHTSISVHPDDTAGAETISALADWDRIEATARERLAVMEREAGIIRRWLTLPRRGKIELRA